MSVSLFSACQDGPSRMQLPVFAEQVIPAQKRRGEIPDSHGRPALRSATGFLSGQYRKTWGSVDFPLCRGTKSGAPIFPGLGRGEKTPLCFLSKRSPGRFCL